MYFVFLFTERNIHITYLLNFSFINCQRYNCNNSVFKYLCTYNNYKPQAFINCTFNPETNRICHDKTIFSIPKFGESNSKINLAGFFLFIRFKMKLLNARVTKINIYCVMNLQISINTQFNKNKKLEMNTWKNYRKTLI